MTKLIVGLGNPGKEYEKTRHNVGFMALDSFSSIICKSIDKEKFNGLYTDFLLNGEKFILLKPQKFMNLSGEVVKKYIDYFNIKNEDILIISDDINLPVGKIRIRLKGSAGGHNGLKNIEQHLSTNEYKRLKIGVSNDKNQDLKDFVLGKFSKEDLNTLEEIYPKVKDIIENIFFEKIENLMNKYN